MSRAFCLLPLVLLSGCELFGGIDAAKLPYHKTLLWQQSAGASQGAPGVSADAVFVLDQRRNLLALDRRDGTIRWSIVTQQNGLNSGVSVVDQTAITAAGALAAFDIPTRALAWQSQIPDGLGGLPVAIAGTVILPSSYASPTGMAYALTTDQQVVWQTSILPPDSVVGSGDIARVFTPARFAGALVYSFMWWRGSTQSVPKGGVAVVDANTGNLRWSRLIPVLNPSTNTAPSDAVTDGSAVFVTSKDGRVLAFSIDDGRLLWTAGPVTPASEVGAPDSRPLTVVDRTVVVGSGRSVMTGYGAQTGERKWQVDTENGGTAQIHSFGSNGALAMHFNGGLSLREAATGRLLWIIEPRSNSDRVNSLHIAGDTVFGTSADVGLQAFILRPR